MTASRESPPLDPAELEAGLGVARTQKVALFIVAYNAEAHIEETIRRVPEPLLGCLAAIYLIDDHSTDSTVGKAEKLQAELPGLRVFSTPYNQGYGGNQKIGYTYAVAQGYDLVALLHGDGQYAPEVLPRLLAPFADPAVAAVFGSRMLEPGAARKGSMPLYKRVGNRILTTLQNRMMGSDLSEWHSGYRAYRVTALKEIPFEYNTRDFHFDTQIIIQLLAAGREIREVPIPTYYGDEICRVEGVPYALRCLASVAHYLATRLELFYHPRYEPSPEVERYRFKRAPHTVHQWVLAQTFAPGEAVVDFVCGDGQLADTLHGRGAEVLALDRRRPARVLSSRFLTCDLDAPLGDEVGASLGRRADTVLALDVLEHLNDADAGVREIHSLLRSGGRLIASTANVGFFVIRLMLLLGHFNYGRRGILDLTHKRLFTLAAFRRLLESEGFRVDRVEGFGPPIRDMISERGVLRWLDALLGWLARLWPRLFAYQLLVVATRLDSLEEIVEPTVGVERRSGAER